jgi:uncharacterized membrane protein
LPRIPAGRLERGTVDGISHKAFVYAHMLIGSGALLLGIAIIISRKGDRRHRLLGWIIWPLLLIATLSGIDFGLKTGDPFYFYAMFVLLTLFAGIGASRFRARIPHWRIVHAGSMSIALMSAAMAFGSVAISMALGNTSQPVFYRIFNPVIAATTIAGMLALRGSLARSMPSRIHWSLQSVIALSSAALIAAQWPMMEI